MTFWFLCQEYKLSNSIMKQHSFSILSCLVAGLVGFASSQVASNAAGKVAVQTAANVVGTGADAWSYLLVEGEEYVSETNDSEGVGFTRVDSSGTITSSLGNPVLGKNTTASKKGALWMQNAARHGDKVTYNVQFAKAGTYYLYMRFTMFESGVGPTHYLNEDSFFVPPEFDKDPQTDWPLSDAAGQNGGYTEGCCDGAGFLFIPEKGGGGVRVPRQVGIDADGNPTGQAYWEGNFHWNDLFSSQFLNAATQGEPRVRRKYEVTAAQVGKTLTWTISNRESGLAVDAWLFSTHPDLMDKYSQEELDQLMIAPVKVTAQEPGNVVGTGANAWSYLLVEGEDYDSEKDDAPGVGFTRVDDSGAITSSLGNPVLGKNTTASKKGALWMQNAARHGDKVTYNVKFTQAGTYYLYMRFTMFESGVGPTHYLNEDSFFVPPAFDKDPQTDWPLGDAAGQNGGYTEGCCDGAGFLFIPEKGGGGVRVPRQVGIDADGNPTGQAYWEGNFHWNDLFSSQFLNAATQGEPRVRRKYEVTAAQVGKTLTWTISNRESGLAVDAWLFSTHPDLMDKYSQEELDKLFIKPAGKLTVQDPTKVVGTGANAWSYLLLEGEDYAVEKDETAGVGFTRVDDSGAITSSLGNPVLGKNTTASNKGALWMQNAARHGDKVTYNVQFEKAGTYYLYMRFTMFESGVGPTQYLNEDSFFVPPAFDKDPQTDWPLSDAAGQNGGYTEGCCDGAGFLFIPEKGGGGVRLPRQVGIDADGNPTGQSYWEGNFHWNDLFSSQFLNATTQGEPRARRKYEVTAAQVGRPLTWTISNRESGLAVDAWLFSTHADLMDAYSQDELDQLLLAASPRPKLSVSVTGKNATFSWASSSTGFVLETAGAVNSPTWTLVATPAVVAGGQNSVTVDISNGTQFYRLRKP